jgi:hypothetical protein
MLIAIIIDALHLEENVVEFVKGVGHNDIDIVFIDFSYNYFLLAKVRK